MIDVECTCGRMFEARNDQAGGIVNCPGCGEAAQVPGLRDPYWRLVQAGAAVAWAAATALAFVNGGAAWGLGVAVVFGGLLVLFGSFL